MKRIKAWLGFGMVTFIKILCGLAAIKIVSYKLGPEVFGKLAQLMTLVAIISMFAGGGISNGLMQRLASSKSKKEKMAYINASLTIYLVSSTLIFILLIMCSASDLSFQLFGEQDLTATLLVLALSQWLVGAYNISQAIFSGYQHIQLFIFVNIAGSLFGTCVLISLLFLYGSSGATYGIVLLPACAGPIALILLLKIKQISWTEVRLKLWTTEVKTLLSYSLVMLVAASSVSGAQILVRSLLAEEQGWAAAGYWFGVVKISDVYMQFIGLLLANYAMPIFSKTATLHELKTEVRKMIFPLVTFSAIALAIFYNLRAYITIAFFSEQFIQMDPLFLPQLIGDYLRIIFSVFVYVLLARGNRFLLILIELAQGLGLFIFSYFLLAQFGIMAPVYAHVLVYALMLLFIVAAYLLLRQRWFIKDCYECIDAVY